MFMFNIPETTARRKILEKHQQMKKKRLQSSDETDKNEHSICRVVAFNVLTLLAKS